MQATRESDGLTLSSQELSRGVWIGILARSAPADLNRLASSFVLQLSWTWLKSPETGLVLVRGRIGGTGDPFNVGEMTVTRCALRLADGIVGHGYVQGTDSHHAKLAALVDAALQRDDENRTRLCRVIQELREIQVRRRKERCAKAASTKVEFFTMVRGENSE
ncbi:phosphonate C-P lyase system protein PhnG [Bradyrhizobium sp. CCBAU 53421]|uniref:phosphonate C-P lyase system protein PhnG n=1 Tax=Bradyrhizobium sp. CCBAU 53421 TaxID=1325120 RepID=UPI00188A79C5|nr:phosphonate C-P lyase system protein PhnG [Bradyrhizobium sp. CCBAU 53421]QOZ33238.1 phosphonate C-P lyase system protein PhnG [Bradyrhizobium sp. CCBAU 53421]